MRLRLATVNKNACSGLECGGSSYRLGISTFFIHSMFARFSYGPRAEGGGCCYRTPRYLETIRKAAG